MNTYLSLLFTAFITATIYLREVSSLPSLVTGGSNMISYVPLNFKEHADDDLQCTPSKRQSYPHIMVPLLVRGGEGYRAADRPGLHKIKRDPAAVDHSRVPSSSLPNKSAVKSRPTTTTSIDTKVPVVGGGGTSSIPASVFNLVNNVAGAGLLTLAAGKASSNVGWIPAILIASCLAALSAHTFTLIGRACEITGEKNFSGLWSAAFGTKSSPLVSLIVFLQGSASQIIYLGMLGDIFTALFQMMGLPNSINNRSTNILLLTSLFLLPMCLLRNLAALAFTSILGFSAVMYTVLFIAVRALDGTYSLGTSPNGSAVGKFIIDNSLAFMPSFDKSSWWNINFKSLLLVSNLGLAYIAHYNAPTYFRELKHATAARFSKTVGISYGILALIYVVTMCAGYATFGDACRNNILLNYHPQDILSTLGRWATGFSILFGYPLVNNGAREGLKNFCSSAMGWKAVLDPRNHHLITVLYLATLTLIAISVRDVGLVVGLSGSIFGSFLVYICPALIYATIVKKTSGQDSMEYSKAKLNIALIPFGLFCGAMGVSMTIKEALMKKK